MGHVVSIADPSHAQAVERTAEVLANGHHVGQQLHRVVFVREPIDDGNGRVARQGLEAIVAKGSIDRGVHVSAQHARRIFDGFTPPELSVLGYECHRMSTELVDADLE